MKKSLFLSLAISVALSTVVLAEMRVYDNNAQFIGVPIQEDDFFIPDLQKTCNISNKTGTLFIASVFFTGSDCQSGTVYVQCTGTGSETGHLGHIVRGPDAKLYTENSVQSQMVANLYELRSLPEGGTSCTSVAFPMPLCEAVIFNQANLPFTLPVALPLTYEYTNCCDQSRKAVVIPLGNN